MGDTVRPSTERETESEAKALLRVNKSIKEVGPQKTSSYCVHHLYKGIPSRP